MLKYWLAAMAVSAFSPAMASSGDAPIRWSGPNTGVESGAGGSKINHPATATVAASSGGTIQPFSNTMAIASEAHQSSTTMIGRGQIDYNFLYGANVFGDETGIATTRIKNKASQTGSAIAYRNGAASAAITSRLDRPSTVRTRVGAALIDGRILPYAVGGPASGTAKKDRSGAMGTTNLSSVQNCDARYVGWATWGRGRFCYHAETRVSRRTPSDR